VPTMRATLQGPNKPQVNAQAVDMDVQVNYLSGGAAAMLPVKMRSQIQPRSVQFADYEGFVFANGGVKAGKEDARNRPTTYVSEEDEEESAPQVEDGVDPAQLKTLKVLEFNLDSAGAMRARIEGIPRSDTPKSCWQRPSIAMPMVKRSLLPDVCPCGLPPWWWVSSPMAGFLPKSI